jgi:hypothetical protein
VIKNEEPDRRESNGGFRKLDLERVLIFLTRLRRKTPFQELGYQYGCGEESARRYFEELVDISQTLCASARVSSFSGGVEENEWEGSFGAVS